MLNHSGTLHNVAERLEVERLEQATDNCQIAKKIMVKGSKFVSDGS